MGVLWRGSVAQRLRLVTGLILFTFAAAHFLNHALGLVSLSAVETFDGWRIAITRSLPGTVILAAALLTHASLALYKLAGRRTLRLQRWEWLQIGLGLAIPVLLLPHIINTRVANLAFGIQTTYPYELVRIWADLMVDQTLLLLIVWTHGCIGLHYWLRLSPHYRIIAPALLALAVLLPAAAWMGVVVQGRALTAEMTDPARFAALKAATNWPNAATAGQLYWLRFGARLVVCLIAAGVLLFMALRILARQRALRIPVQYAAGPLVKATTGPTVLEVSRMYGIPHASVCGGRARCSTCRILVLSGESGLAPPNAAELATLRAIGAADNIRLACQARLTSAVTVLPIVRLQQASEAALLGGVGVDVAGVERDLAVLFVDIRGFTALTERKLAYDVVFILNQFFEATGKAIYGSGGWISNRAGDGVLALFAHPDGMADACRLALLAASEIDRAIIALNVRIADELTEPLRIAMGLHCGPHVLGRMGFQESMSISVVGPAVNVASRLEAVAKAADVQMAMSAAVARHALLDVEGLTAQTIPIRGSADLDVLYVTAARELGPRLARAPLLVR